MRIVVVVTLLLVGCASRSSLEREVEQEIELDACHLDVLAPRMISALGARSDTARLMAIYEWVPRDCAPWMYSCSINRLKLTCDGHQEVWSLTGGDERRGLETSVLITAGQEVYEERLLLQVIDRDSF